MRNWRHTVCCPDRITYDSSSSKDSVDYARSCRKCYCRLKIMRTNRGRRRSWQRLRKIRPRACDENLVVTHVLFITRTRDSPFHALLDTSMCVYSRRVIHNYMQTHTRHALHVSCILLSVTAARSLRNSSNVIRQEGLRS